MKDAEEHRANNCNWIVQNISGYLLFQRLHGISARRTYTEHTIRPPHRAEAPYKY
jgi:hypothetical protein